MIKTYTFRIANALVVLSIMAFVMWVIFSFAACNNRQQDMNDMGGKDAAAETIQKATYAIDSIVELQKHTRKVSEISQTEHLNKHIVINDSKGKITIDLKTDDSVILISRGMAYRLPANYVSITLP